MERIPKIKLGNYRFDGPLGSIEQKEDQAGLFAIYCLKKDRGYYILDVDESDKIKSAILNHPRIEEWKQKTEEENGVITFAVYYTPRLDQEGRKKVENDIRSGEVFIPCGG